MNDYADLERRWKALRSRGDVAVREVACVGAARTLLCVEFGDVERPAIALSAGVHGDEPAGPWALLALIESDALDREFSYRIWPCTNPTGYARGTRESADGCDINRSFGRGGTTPEARAIVTANRNRKFELSVDLHEDCDAAGFYCYEYGAEGAGEAALSGVRVAGFALAPGEALIRPEPAEEIAAIGGLSYSLSVVRHAALRALTFETPTSPPFADRVAMHGAAVRAALAALSQHSR